MIDEKLERKIRSVLRGVRMCLESIALDEPLKEAGLLQGEMVPRNLKLVCEVLDELREP